MNRPDGGAVGSNGGQPHHISSIAHLFFGDQADDREATLDVTERFLAVGSLDTGQLAAYAAAGLSVVATYPATRAARCRGRSLATAWPAAGAAVTVREALDEVWSVASFLSAERAAAAADDGPSLPATFLDRRPAAVLFGRVLRLSEPGTEPLPPDDPRYSRLDVVNCGSLTATDGVLAALGGSPPGRCPAGRAWTGAAVCLTDEQTGSWRTVGLIGELCERLRPGRLEVMVFPADWRRAHQGLGAHLAADAGEGGLGDLRTRLDGLLATLAPQLDWRLSGAPRRPAGSPPGPDEAWLVDTLGRLF